ncbi:MAG: ABC transporter permease [Tepidiforma sp.]|nr:MAG: ABC transporter permease [Tepidiforma sp.]
MATRAETIARGAGAAWRWRLAALPTLAMLLGAAVLLNLVIGAVRVPPTAVLGVLLDHLGLPGVLEYTQQQEAVVWNIRVPRTLLALVVGAGLATAGCALQGIFRNPLADPGIIGVSSGAALGAVGIIILGIAPLGAWSTPAAAFGGGLALTLMVYVLSRRDGRTEVVTLVLTGVALNAIAGGIIGFALFFATDAQLRNVVFWQLGSVGGATWPNVRPAIVLASCAVLPLLRYGHRLNLLALGEREAYHLGVDTERLRLEVIALAALATAAAVSFAGIISFVGLVVPHMLRLMLGPDHRRLLPASALLGAAAIALADLAARTVVAPAEMPLGVVTALAGGPYFLWLIHRTRRAQGGWG